MRCCWTGGRPWAGLPWAASFVPREESLREAWSQADCATAGCGTTEVISVPGGSADAYCDLEAPACLAPPGLSVLPPVPRPSWCAAPANGQPTAEPPAREAPVPATTAAQGQPQMQLRIGTGPSAGSSGPWNADNRPVRRHLGFGTGEWDPTLDYVPRGHTLWEERLEADWADEDSVVSNDASTAEPTADDMWRPETPSEDSPNTPFFLEEP